MNYKLVLRRSDNSLPSFLTLEDIKSYLRVDFEEDDKLLVNLAIAACEKAENFIGISVLERSVSQVNYDIYDSHIKLYQSPVIKVERVLDERSEMIPDQEWEFNNRDYTIIFKQERRASQISIDYISGFTKNNISQSIKVGLLEHIMFLYDGKSNAQEMPVRSIDLYSLFRNRKVWR